MRAKGKERVKQFKGGVDKQRKKLNDHVDDHCDLVDDVRDLARKQQNWLGDMRLIYVDLGVESQEVTFRYALLNGYDDGPVEASA